MKPKPDKCESCGHEIDLGDDVMLIDDEWLCSYCAHEFWEEDLQLRGERLVGAGDEHA